MNICYQDNEAAMKTQWNFKTGKRRLIRKQTATNRMSMIGGCRCVVECCDRGAHAQSKRNTRVSERVEVRVTPIAWVRDAQ